MGVVYALHPVTRHERCLAHIAEMEHELGFHREDEDCRRWGCWIPAPPPPTAPPAIERRA